MRLIRSLNQIKTALPKTVLTIGNFDGIHLGHLEIIKEIKRISKAKNLSTAILTFEPHPISFLRPDRPKDFRISSLAEKLRIFRELEIDFVIALPFNQALADIEAENFIYEILIKKINTQHLVIGYDFIFGKNREGNFRLLEEKSKELNFDLSEVSAIKAHDYTCSSTIIRHFIKAGDISSANQILGKEFSVSGLVNEGRKLANQLGFPTANIISKNHIIKPKFGVYKTITHIPHLNLKLPSITNFGIKPTLDEAIIPLYETHILNFSQNIYGKKIIVEFIDFIRDEKKFASLEELKKQIALDVTSLDYLITNANSG
jgi:riboflavin kinase/FMN adenylyltransferase